PEAGLRGARDPRGDPRRREAAGRGEPAARPRPVRTVLLAPHRGAGALRRHRGALRGAAADGRDFPLGADDHRPGAPRTGDRRGAPGAGRAAPGAALTGPAALIALGGLARPTARR